MLQITASGIFQEHLCLIIFLHSVHLYGCLRLANDFGQIYTVPKQEETFISGTSRHVGACACFGSIQVVQINIYDKYYASALQIMTWSAM